MKKKTKSTVSLKKEDIQKLLKRQNSTLERLKRELKIEAALERVRVVALGMKQPNELLDICETVYQELQVLGFTELRNAMINIHDDDQGSFLNYDYSDRAGKTITTIFYNSHPSTKNLVKQIKKSNDAFAAIEIKGRELDKWRDYRKSMGEEDDPKLDNTNTLTYYFYSIGAGAIGISTYNPISEEKRKLLKRFRNVFDFAYRRYRDVTQAEVQAREARIETALERVRSRTMAMHQSEELLQVITVVAEQLLLLDYKFDNVSFAVRNQAHDYKFWFSSPGAPKPFFIQVPYTNNPMFERVRYIQGENLNLYCDTLTVEENRQWHQHVFENSELQYLPEKRKQYILNMGYARTIAFMPTIMMILGNYSAMPYTVEENKVFKRFAEVFEQSYTRFLDLQKAEAQAREAQIQLALERVRARTMAMQHSDELREAASVLFGQVKELGIEAWTCGYNIWDENRKTVLAWLSRGVMQPAFKIPITENPTLMHFYEAAQRGEALYVEEVGGETLTELYRYLGTLLLSAGISDEVRKPGYSPPTYQVNHTAYFSYGYLLFVTYKPVPEAHPIFKRFAKVFEQTYTRFLDLQKAEAQAKEAQIEAALEKVRSRSLAMHNSSELEQVVGCLFDRLVELGLSFDGALIFVFDKERRNIVLWIATNQLPAPIKVDLPYDIEIENNMIITDLWNAIENGEHLFSKSYSGEIKNDYFRYVAKYNESKIPEPIRQLQIDKGSWLTHFVAQKNSILGFDTWSGHITADEDIKILIRFSRVFEQAYTRFLDLQKAEAQARESKIQLALERVRARTMAMHDSSELSETAQVLFQQLANMGGMPDRISIGIVDEKNEVVNFWTTDQTGSQIAKSFQATLYESTTIAKAYVAWKNQEKYIQVDLEGKELKDWIHFAREEMGIVVKDDFFKDRRVHQIAIFSHGWIMVSTYEPQTRETINILERFASVFNLTFRRFLDLQKAEAQAKEAQIEAALERVRAQSMAMHHTDDLQVVINTVAEQLQNLNMDISGGVFITINAEVEHDLPFWGAAGTASYLQRTVVPFLDRPIFTYLRDAIVNRNGFLVEEYTKEEKIEFLNHIFKYPPFNEATPERKEEVLTRDGGYTRSVVISEHTSIFIINHYGKKFSNADNDILKRFGRVFEQTYTRFLDLQKAEVQTREAQIELSLERVRAKTMAMHNSQDVGNTVATMFEQLIQLGVTANRCGIIIFKDTNDMEVWTAKSNPTGEAALIIGYLDVLIHPMLQAVRNAWKNKENFFSYELMGEDITNYYKAINNSPGYPARFNLDRLPSYEIHSDFFFPEGAVFSFTSETMSVETSLIFKRFAGVFGQTYRRYLDLQKAEAQAREAKIEASLEKIRGRAMAMHKSDELLEAGSLLYKELLKLGIPSLTSGYVLMDEDERMGWNYGVHPTDGSILPHPVGIPHTESLVMEAIKTSWKKQDPFFVLQLDPGETIKHQTYIAEQSIHFPLSAAELIAVTPERLILQSFNFKQGYLLIVGGEVLPLEKLDMVARFAKVFELTYRRFLDLKQAEAQTREAQIELSLERVRARAMSMQNSEELNALIGTVFTELTRLDLALTRCLIMIYEPATHAARWWMANSEAPETPMNFLVKYHEHAPNLVYFKAWQERTLKLEYILEGKTKKEWDDFLFSETELSLLPDFVIAGMKAPERVYLNASFNNFGNLTLASLEPLSNEHFDILLRFAKVFDLTYTRFNDLQKAEVQAREAQIEAALERVRSRSMGMQKSEELKEVIRVVYEQFVHLNIHIEHTGFIIDYKERDDMHIWLADRHEVPFQVTIPYFDCAHWNSFIEAKAKGKEFFANLLSFEEKNKFYTDLFKLFPVPEETKEYYFNCPGLAISTVLLDNIGLYIENFSGIPYTVEENNTLMRFGKVFQQTYTRFIDLQNAEAQARESKIEAALEKVRSRSLAMHKAEELGEVITVVVEKLKELDFSVVDGVALITYTEGSKNLLEWMANPGFPSAIKFHLPYFEHPVLANLWKAKNEGADFVVERYTAEENKSFLEHIFEHSDFKHTPQPVKDYCLAADTYATFIAFQKNTSIFINDYSGNSLSDQEIDILKRFSKVFEQAYIRFLDLQKAEAQAREAEIEVALERVRSSTMAMHQSTQILDVIQVLCDQLVHLEFPIHSVNIATQFTDGDYHMWVHAPGGPMYPNQIVIPSIYDYFPELKIALDQGIELVTAKLSSEARRRFWDHLFTNTIFKDASPPERKKFLYATRGYAQTFILQKNTIMSMLNYDGNPFSPDHNQIFKRFSYSFEQSYVRFLDLVKAEAQAREAKIEASLERVRSKAMAMHSSRDLAETIKTFYQQVEILSAIPRRLGIGIINKETHTVELITMNSTEKGDSVEIIGSLVLTGHPVLEGIYNNWLAQKEYKPVLMGNALRDYYNIVRPQMPCPDYPTTYAQYGYFFFFPEGGVYAWTEEEMSGDELQLYRRFTSVLSLTYKRYRDLKEAEAQAREASIQLALERVRARTMAMQSSEELVEASQLLFEEFKKLNLVSLGEFADRAFIGIPDKSHDNVEFWSTDLKGTGINYMFKGSVEEPYLFNRTIQAWKKEEKSIVIVLEGTELASYLDYLKSIGFPVMENHYQRKRIHYFAFFSKGLVGISTAHQLPPETLPLLERFAGVFDLTYTRFLDLQKAEAQVRESKIELALERVRARTMAMQRSEELAEAAEVLFKQFADLGNEPDRISIGIIDEVGGFTDLWATDQQGRQLRILFKARNSEKTTFKKMVAAWKAGKKSMIIDLRDDELKEWIQYIRNEMGLTIRDEHFNNRRIHQVSFFSQGWLNITTLEPVTDEVLSLLNRFAAVFNLTFTRFLDLKKAEAQTRQAQIETAMEKVRARSLAMQKPEELKEVAQVLRSEMGVLGVEELETCSIYILDETTGKTNCWYAIKDDKHTEQNLVSDYMIMDLNDTWVGRKMLEFYHSDQQQTSILMQGEPRKEWIKYCISKSDLFDDTFYGENIPDRTYHLNKFSNGYLGAASPGEISAESWELLKRATAVFSLAYTRFSDLQRSEANTREAVKQASMDRVRAEIASMRAPADLEKIIPLLWSELTVLGVPFIRCGVFIMDNPEEQIHTYLSTPEGKALAAFDIPYSTPGNISQLLSHWRDKKAYLDEWDEEDFKEFAANLVRLGAMSSQEQYLSTLPPGGFYLHFLPFLQGMLYVGNLTALQEDELNLIQSVADAFSTAYARYEDFNNLEAAKLQVDRALVNLKQAQQQLVQSEKMASLGELTAGIAHEIQNPLNFVNNFSEVNTELIDEIKQAVQSGNNEEVLALAENVKQNLEKINFHGKRADGIVKSMLQHSRTSDQGGKNLKEPTDINVLAEEYLRLAYHGLRAKDKAFNATLKTDFDESIGLIQVMGQDIARAILNLITNAFYAVQEKQRQGVSSSRVPKLRDGTPPVLENYQPIVSITTKKTSDSTIEISVKDNGPGIPQQVLDKIFQPFFTTKPTGQGTGLGLSLCYDIVKAHRGELKVKTVVGEGSEFIIQLPV